MRKKLSLALVLVLILSTFLNVSVLATQNRSYNFNKGFTLTGNLANDIVAVAKAQLGKTKSQLGYTEAWCADFVTDCARLTKMSDKIIPYNYGARGACTSLYNYMISNCNAQRVSSRQKGDLVFYYCSKCKRYVHVGIVENSTTSIEGNFDSKVSNVTSSYKDAGGHTLSSGYVSRTYLRPAYSSSSVSSNTTTSTTSIPLFDATYYAIKYPDLYAAFGYDANALLNHWNNFGKKEGRSPSPIYDPEYYRSHNADLQKAFGNDNVALYNHFVQFGINEFRPSSPIYYGLHYKISYTDLQNAFGNNSAAYIQHFLDFGMKEGRSASPDFNVQNYKNRYQDLRNAFGNDLKSYYYHYMEYGIREGRNGK